MKRIVLKPLFHRGKENIAMYFHDELILKQAVRKIKMVRWSATHACWYVLRNEENFEAISLAFRNIAEIDRTVFLLPAVQKLADPIGFKGADMLYKGMPDRQKKNCIHPVNAHVLPLMRERLLLKAYSLSTIKTYLNELSQLLILVNHLPVDDFTPVHLKRYLVYCYEKLSLSENTLHSRINALKFYYEQVLHREKFFWDIPRPKKQLLLPRFFSQQDIVSILRATNNIKHKVMLMLAYGAGLRISEVVAMKVRNIDSNRMTILIEEAKGKKDRFVRLSPVLLVMLREYFKKYGPDPNGYLFPGQNAGQYYSTRSLQLVLVEAKKRAGILKPGSVHALRHSFATHLLDRGTDVTLIMKLLGHNDIKTTLRYLHVTNRDLVQVFSPLDDLDM